MPWFSYHRKKPFNPGIGLRGHGTLEIDIYDELLMVVLRHGMRESLIKQRS